MNYDQNNTLIILITDWTVIQRNKIKESIANKNISMFTPPANKLNVCQNEKPVQEVALRRTRVTSNNFRSESQPHSLTNYTT